MDNYKLNLAGYSVFFCKNTVILRIHNIKAMLKQVRYGTGNHVRKIDTTIKYP